MKKKDIFILPNIITLLRIALAPVFFTLLINLKTAAGLVVFLIAALTDWADGLAARLTDQKTKFGEFLDPMADKLIVILAVIALMMRFSFPYYGLLMLSRDIVSLTCSALVYKKKQANWKPSIFGKLTTFLQIITIGMFIIANRFSYIILAVSIVFSITTAVQYSIRVSKVMGSG